MRHQDDKVRYKREWKMNAEFNKGSFECQFFNNQISFSLGIQNSEERFLKEGTFVKNDVLKSVSLTGEGDLQAAIQGVWCDTIPTTFQWVRGSVE